VPAPNPEVGGLANVLVHVGGFQETARHGAKDHGHQPSDEDHHAAPKTVTLTLSEFQLQPADITVNVGQPITLVLKNKGTVLHDFVSMDAKVDVTEEHAARHPVLAGGRHRPVGFCQHHAGPEGSPADDQ